MGYCLTMVISGGVDVDLIHFHKGFVLELGQNGVSYRNLCSLGVY